MNIEKFLTLAPTNDDLDTPLIAIAKRKTLLDLDAAPNAASCCQLARQVLISANFNDTFTRYRLKYRQVNAQNSKQETALHWACIHQDEELIHFLIDNGALLNIADMHGSTPIHFVENCSVVMQLVERGAVMNAKTMQKWITNIRLYQTDNEATSKEKLFLHILPYCQDLHVPLQLAIQQNHGTFIKMLVERGARPSIELLALVVQRNQIDVANEFLQIENLQVNGPCDLLENSLLHIAAQFGYLEMAQWLVARGAQVAIAAPDTKRTPIMDACYARHEHVVHYLQNQMTAQELQMQDSFQRTIYQIAHLYQVALLS